jgi:uncharacterized protein YbaP (TraB family)
MMGMRMLAAGVVGVGLAFGCVAAFGQGEPPKVETMAPPAAAAPAGQGAAGTEASPAMWAVKKGPTTVYLFGTVHVMKKDVHWETPKVEAAFKASPTLWLEVADIGPATQAAMKPMLMQLGMDPSHPLSSKISKEDVAALDTGLKAVGGEAAVETMQPWLVYLTLSVLPVLQAGYDPSSGIDQVLQQQAEVAGKKVKGFETAEEQVHYLADFPQAEQVALLHEELVELPKAVDKTNEMVADWEHGDVAKIAAMENDELMEKHPELYKKLLVDRNVAIAQKVEGMLKDPTSGTVFVAIGAAHLAGPDSIQKLLEKDGFVAERVE